MFKYEGKDIATVIYEKVDAIMETKKGKLYKEFKKRYTEEYLLIVLGGIREAVKVKFIMI